MKSVMLVEDHSIVRIGISSLVEKSENFSILGSFSSGQEALKAIKESSPDIAIVDLSLPDLPGDLLIQELFMHSTHTKVVVLSRQKYIPQISHLLSLGVQAYVVKDWAAEELIEALEKVSEGKRFISPSVNEILKRMGIVTEDSEDPRSLKEPLTHRELEIAKLLCLGSPSKEIAGKLGISPATVRVHTKNILDKFGLPLLKDFTKLSKHLF